MLRYCGVLAVLASTVACAQQEPVHRPAMAASVTADVLLRAENAVIESRVPRHATLDSLLRQHRLPAELVNVVVRSAASVFNPRQLRADRPYRLVLSLDGFLREFEYEIDADRLLRIISRDRTRPNWCNGLKKLAVITPTERASRSLSKTCATKLPRPLPIMSGFSD